MKTIGNLKILNELFLSKFPFLIVFSELLYFREVILIALNYTKPYRKTTTHNVMSLTLCCNIDMFDKNFT